MSNIHQSQTPNTELDTSKSTFSGYLSTSSTNPIFYQDNSTEDRLKWNSTWYEVPKMPIKSPISTLDEQGKMKMKHNNIHIQPANNGFIVNIYTKEEGLKVYCFSDFKGVLTFLKDLAIMDIDDEIVADNI